MSEGQVRKRLKKVEKKHLTSARECGKISNVPPLRGEGRKRPRERSEKLNRVRKKLKKLEKST